MLQDYIEFPPYEPLPLGHLTPEEAALELRRTWELGDGPIDNLVPVLEQHGIETFSAALKESRNRIAHIKAKQGKLFLDGKESVLYLCKLSMLYRIILFDLLEIPPNTMFESGL